MNRMIGGCNVVLQALQRGQVQRLYVDERKKNKKIQKALALAAAQGVPIERCPDYRLDMLTGDLKHQGVIAEIAASDLDPHDWFSLLRGLDKPLVLLLDGLQDPHNFGACLRSAAAAGVDVVLYRHDRAVGLTPTVSKAACGAAESLPIFPVVNMQRAARRLRDLGIWLIAAEGRAEKSLYEADLNRPLAIVMGSEEKGIAASLLQQCDGQVAIPMRGDMESLNVSAACAIFLFEALRQRGATGLNAQGGLL